MALPEEEYAEDQSILLSDQEENGNKSKSNISIKPNKKEKLKSQFKIHK